MRLRDDRRQVCTFGYLDESGSSQRWFACGLLVHGPRVSGFSDFRLNEHIRALKLEAGIQLRGDVGWKKVPTRQGKYLEFYRRCVEGFFRHPKLAFHAMVVDTHRYPLDSKTLFRGSKDLGMDEFAFGLVRCSVVEHWGGGERLYVRFDRRSRPEEAALARVSRRLGVVMPRGTRVNVRSVTGGKHPLLQVADLLLGAITASLNATVTSAGRLELLELLEGRLGRNPAEPTPPEEAKFNVCRFEV